MKKLSRQLMNQHCFFILQNTGNVVKCFLHTIEPEEFSFDRNKRFVRWLSRVSVTLHHDLRTPLFWYLTLLTVNPGHKYSGQKSEKAKPQMENDKGRRSRKVKADFHS